MREKRRNSKMALMLAFAFLGASLYMAAQTFSDFNTSAWAKDGESESGSGSGNDSEDSKESDKEDEEKSKEDESAKKQAEKAREAAKKSQEMKRESEKKQQESVKKQKEREVEFNKQDDETENEIESEDLEDEESDVSHAQERYQEAIRKIAEAEEEIAKKKAEGKGVSFALERLATAKAQVEKSKQSLDGQDLTEAEDLAKSAEKLAEWASGKDIESENESSRIIRSAEVRIQQAEKKLSQLAALGGETASYQESIDTVRKHLIEAKNLLQQGPVVDGVKATRTVEREAKTVKHSIESAILAFGGDDDELADDHRGEISKSVEELLSVADIEGGSIGKKVRDVAKSQHDSSEETTSLIEDAQSRTGISKFLLGPSYDQLDGIQERIAKNQDDIVKLGEAAQEIDDSDLKSVIEEQVAVLQQENEKLQSFIAGEQKEPGVFGWIFRLFRS